MCAEADHVRDVHGSFSVQRSPDVHDVDATNQVDDTWEARQLVWCVASVVRRTRDSGSDVSPTVPEQVQVSRLLLPPGLQRPCRTSLPGQVPRLRGQGSSSSIDFPRERHDERGRG